VREASEGEADAGVGFAGTAEPMEGVELDEEPVATFEGLGSSTLQDLTGASIKDLSTEDLSLVTKFIIFGVIVAVCYAFVRSRTPTRTAFAGRHGAYEKGALP